jgi:hypothetical protein
VPVLLVAYISLMIWTRTPHVPFWDEWDTVAMVQHATQGALTWNDFWMFHNEHRIVIPRMFDLAIILMTRWNRQIEMTFDVFLAVAEWALLIASVHRGLRSKSLTILAIAPTSLAIFSLMQYENWLWAFQITFICTVFGVAISLWGLTASRGTWGTFAIALIGALIAALSSLGGLAIFLALLPAIISQGYRKTLVWIALAVGVIVPYMQGFPHSVPIKVSLMTLKFCITYLGASAGAPSVNVSFMIGLVSLGLAILNVLYYWVREHQIVPLLPWIGLGAFVIGLALITSFGRITTDQDLSLALTPRYQAFVALWWVAVVYLLLLNCQGAWAHMSRASNHGDMIRRASPFILGANSLLLALATVGLVWANWSYVPFIRNFQYQQLQTEACIVNDAYATTPCLWEYHPDITYLRPQIAYLRAEHFGVFSGDYQNLEQPTPNPSAHALIHYFEPSTGDNWITTSYGLDFYGPYAAEETLGYLYDQQQPKTHALYTCVTTNGRHFVSLNRACAGGTYLRTEGWLLNKPVAGLQNAELFDCAQPGNDAVSIQPTCGGSTKATPLGYALAHLP